MGDITYRDLRASDFDDLFNLVSNWEVVRMLGGWPWPAEIQHTRDRCGPYKGDGFVWAICDEDQLIGTVGVTTGSLGYMLWPSYAGRGLMTLAVETALRRAFEELEMVTASTWFDNPASSRILEKVGFEHVGTSAEHAKARNALTQSHAFELSRKRWQTLRRDAQ